jgi:uncharacterized membrane protein YeiH
VISAAFVIPFWADILAIGIGALQGALFAAQYRDRRLDLLGVAIVGIASGFGGGLVRDVLLAEVPAALQSNWYLPVAVAAALLGMLLERVFSRLNSLITVLDALTIGLFGAIGTTKALSLGVPEVPAVFVGVISAVGGSILRDILLNLRRGRPARVLHSGGPGAARGAGDHRGNCLRRDHLRSAGPCCAVQLESSRTTAAGTNTAAPTSASPHRLSARK